MIAPGRETPHEEIDDIPGPERTYGETRLWLVARDPSCLFCYWEFRPEEHSARECDAPAISFSLRIYHALKGFESSVAVESPSGHAFIPVANADSAYFAELGYYAGETWCFLVRSNVAQTPPAIVSVETVATIVTLPSTADPSQMPEALVGFAHPQESPAMTVARIKKDARETHDVPPERRELLTKILLNAPGRDSQSEPVNPGEIRTRAQEAILRKLTATRDAAMVHKPIDEPSDRNGPGQRPSSGEN